MNQSSAGAAASDAQNRALTQQHSAFSGRDSKSLVRQPHEGWRRSEERWAAQGEVWPSWAQIPEVDISHERATILAPVLGVILLTLCVVSLTLIKHLLNPRYLAKELTEEYESDTRLPAVEEPKAGALAALQRAANTKNEDPFMGPPISMLQLYRFASPCDAIAVVVAICLACVHGGLMPVAFINMDSIFRCLYLPNDDGSMPPVKSPHTARDAEVMRIVRMYLCTAAIVALARFLAVLLMSRAAKRQGRIVRKALFMQILRQGPEWHDMHEPAELASRVSADTFAYQMGIAESVLDFVRSWTLTISSIFLSALKDWKLTIVMGVCMPVSAYAVTVSVGLIEDTSTIGMYLYAKAGAVAETALTLIRTVATFNGQKRELQKYEGHLVKAEARATRMGIVSGYCFGVNNAVMAFALTLGIYTGSIWVFEDWEGQCWRSNPPFGTCRTGGSMLSAIYTVMWGFIMGLGTMQSSLEAIAQAKGAAQRIFSLLDEPVTVSYEGRKLERVEGHLEFQLVRFSYPSRQAAVALRDVSFRICAGTTCALVGHSGSGKSTVVNLLLRFYRPQLGSIFLDGQDISGLNLRFLRSKMALVEQEPTLFGTTIFENIEVGALGEVGKEEVERAARLANAHSFVSNFSQGYNTIVGQWGAQLSGGQKQRIALARALIRDPTILILDEATSALDAASEQLVQEGLNNLPKSKCRTTLVVAHRLSTIQNADQICVFQEGTLVEQGTHRELLAKPAGAYTKLVSSQLMDAKELSELHTVEEANLQTYEDSCTNALPAAPPVPRQLSSSTTGSPLAAQALLQVAAQKKDAEDKTVDHKGKAAGADLMSRLWGESTPEIPYYMVGVVALASTAFAAPWYMMRFAQTINIFNRPPVVQDPVTKDWIVDLDEGAISHSVSNLCLMVQAIGVFVVVCNVVASYSFHRAAEALTRRLRQMALVAMFRQEMGWHDQQLVGTLTSRLSEQIPKFRLLVGHNLASGVQAFLGVVFGLGISFAFSWRYTCCVLGTFPILVLGVMLTIWGKNAENENLFGGLVSDVLGNLPVVAAYDLEDRATTHFDEYLEKQGVGERFASFCYGLGSSLSVGGIFLVLAADVWFANLFITRGQMHQDRAMLVFFGIFAASMAAVTATVWIGDRAHAQKAGEGFFELIDREPEIDSLSMGGKRPQQAILNGSRVELQDVHFWYPTRPDMPVFQGFSLILEPNTTTALVGPSGSGKSTVVALLQRFYDPQMGAVRLNGCNIRELSISWLREQMGLVQQEPVLFSGSILENIRYGNERASDEQIVRAATAANAHAFICDLPSQYGTDVGTRGLQMSGGQKQRIAIARALVRDPSVLLLDEATAALDSASEKQVQEALDELLAAQRRTTLVIAHRLSTVQGADQICVVNHGRVVQQGTHQELLADKAGLYAKLVGRQQVAAEALLKPIG